ncbi:hypothetical protein DFH07DRAFT_769585 [Mycena maculata]|uniref:Uncharacterized protein n=1 Tax=Mycena maculata TaxID=230809 RepID=A0AAD7JP29_9AGAR|nr:hypothetical protein DFH07DRAFT_769585 [Mycena maculata]
MSWHETRVNNLQELASMKRAADARKALRAALSAVPCRKEGPHNAAPCTTAALGAPCNVRCWRRVVAGAGVSPVFGFGNGMHARRSVRPQGACVELTLAASNFDLEFRWLWLIKAFCDTPRTQLRPRRDLAIALTTTLVTNPKMPPWSPTNSADLLARRPATPASMQRRSHVSPAGWCMRQQQRSAAATPPRPRTVLPLHSRHAPPPNLVLPSTQVEPTQLRPFHRREFASGATCAAGGTRVRSLNSDFFNGMHKVAYLAARNTGVDVHKSLCTRETSPRPCLRNFDVGSLMQASTALDKGVPKRFQIWGPGR